MVDTLAAGAAPHGLDNSETRPVEEAVTKATETRSSSWERVTVGGESVLRVPIPPVQPVGGPVWRAWREGTLTRALELESQAAWLLDRQPQANSELARSIPCHLAAARDAANGVRAKRGFPMFRNGSLLERAMSNIHAAEANLLHVAPADYVIGQMPCLLRHVQCHLAKDDPRRQGFERIAQKLGVKDPDHPLLQLPGDNEQDLRENRRRVDQERGRIVSTVRGASSASLREQLRVRSFRNVLVITIIAMTLLAVLVALTGVLRPTMIPLCFAPEESGRVSIVCPTAHSDSVPAGPQSGPALDTAIEKAAKPVDLFLVEFVGLIAAAVAAAAAVRGIRGSSEPYGLPLALAVLKLPTGAITAFLGLLLMRGQFVPGLSALDTPAQILAWALVFGYAQQLFTRLVDQQAHTVLDSVRGADKAAEQKAVTA
jgi:hypothetical protein